MDDIKSRLLAPRLPEDDVEVPGIGTVRVRGLNRAEAMAVQGVKGYEARERRILACGLVNPALSEAEVGQWQRAAPAGELEPVARRISELSGLMTDSAKQAVREFMAAESDAQFRVLSGSKAGDDGGAATCRDEQ